MSNRQAQLRRQLSMVSMARENNISKNNNDNQNEKPRSLSNSLNLKYVQRTASAYLNDYPLLKGEDLDKIKMQFGPDFTNYFIHNYQPSKLLGEGGYGSVVAACMNRYTCVAVKLQQVFSRQEIQREIEMQTEFAMLSLSPALNDQPRYFLHDGKDFVVLSMDRVDGDLLELIEETEDRELLEKDLIKLAFSITDMIGILANNNLTHGDFSVANMAYIYRHDAKGYLVLKPMLIDMFWSTNKFSDPQFDTLQMLRTLLPKFTPSVNQKSRTFLLKYLMDFYAANWGRIQLEDIETIFEAKAKVYKQRIENDNSNFGMRAMTSTVKRSHNTGRNPLPFQGINVQKPAQLQRARFQSRRINSQNPRRRRNAGRTIRSFYAKP